jgi:hypothetical protein
VAAVEEAVAPAAGAALEPGLVAATVRVLAAAAAAVAVGSGWKATLSVNVGALPAQLLPEAAALAVAPGRVELVSVTFVTPSIRRRWLIVSATAAWLLAQPVTAKVGTLPAGVAEATDEAPPAVELEPELELEPAALELEPAELELEPAELELEPAELELGVLELDPVLEPAAAVPIEPPRLVSDASFGSTRPNSWKACAQSKRESTSTSTACWRDWRSAAKLV